LRACGTNVWGKITKLASQFRLLTHVGHFGLHSRAEQLGLTPFYRYSSTSGSVSLRG